MTEQEIMVLEQQLAASQAEVTRLREVLVDLVANAEVNLADCGCCVTVMPEALFERARTALTMQGKNEEERQV